MRGKKHSKLPNIAKKTFKNAENCLIAKMQKKLPKALPFSLKLPKIATTIFRRDRLVYFGLFWSLTSPNCELT